MRASLRGREELTARVQRALALAERQPNSMLRLRDRPTLDLYTDEDLDEMIAAQEKFLNAVGL